MPVFEVTIGTPLDTANYVIETSGEEIAAGTTNSSHPAKRQFFTSK